MILEIVRIITKEGIWLVRKNYLHIIALIIVVFLVVAFKYAAPAAINVALKANAENTGLSIAQLMGRRIPDLGLLNKDDLLFRELDHSIKMKRVEHLAADVLASENIYQVDFINSDCMCAISLGSFKSKNNQGKVAEYHQSYGYKRCLLYTSPSPRDRQKSRMPSSA